MSGLRRGVGLSAAHHHAPERVAARAGDGGVGRGAAPVAGTVRGAVRAPDRADARPVPTGAAGESGLGAGRVVGLAAARVGGRGGRGGPEFGSAGERAGPGADQGGEDEQQDDPEAAAGGRATASPPRPSASLAGASLAGACLPGASLAGASLTSAPLAGASLTRAPVLGAPRLRAPRPRARRAARRSGGRRGGRLGRGAHGDPYCPAGVPTRVSGPRSPRAAYGWARDSPVHRTGGDRPGQELVAASSAAARRLRADIPAYTSTPAKRNSTPW
ncbi:pentapeptide repeat-containing protein [Streptomyces sp. NPDC056013]|uniref:pentapeptide repeat-containing protein n=1 Tax=Streptomyces sp. NPDC056013 TaxID=3345680 RepID=UPI0035DA4872